MTEYDILFDDFHVAADGLLRGVKGQGLVQRMQTYEGIRTQTAARAIAVAWRTYDLGLKDATERRYFKQPIVEFPQLIDQVCADAC